MKDDANALWPQRQPGPLADLLGARIDQYYALDAAAPLTGALGEGETDIWAETIEPRAKDVEVIERYGPSNGWLDGKAAAVTRRVGKGRITYVGAWPDEAVMHGFAQRLLEEAKVTPVVPDAPAALEVMERAGGGKRVLVLINHGNAPLRPMLPLGAKPVTGDLRDGALPAHGIAVVALPAG
jgi:beta-galactosidase